MIHAYLLQVKYGNPIDETHFVIKFRFGIQIIFGFIYESRENYLISAKVSTIQKQYDVFILYSMKEVRKYNKCKAMSDKCVIVECVQQSLTSLILIL